MEGQRRCYGCMNLKTQPICEHCGYDERRNNAPHQLPVGTVLRDQYVIGRALGQGGFGITYLGWDQYLDIPVAIKEYYPSGIVTRESAVSTVVCNYDGEIGERFQRSKERFMRESRTLARFSDMPEVVQVKSFFLANNTAYIVMEYVQGITMKEYVRRMGGRLTMEQTLEMLRPVIRTLDKLHREGVVHRDISPDNIMILPNGRMKLIDFGAVRDVGRADVDIPLSRSTEAILKQGFAPIEQYQNRGSLGPWTDVYAMCATIYYCVTGHVLLDAPGRLLDSPELNLRQVNMTAQQEQALNRGLELLPAKRTRSMAELEQGLYGEPGGTIPLDDGKTIPLDDGKTIPLDDGKTIPLDDDRTIPLDRDRTVPKRDETKPVEDVVVEETKPKPKPQPKKKATNLTFKQRMIGIAGVLAVFALICFFVSLGAKEPEQDPPAFTISPELQKEMDDKQAALIDGMNSQMIPVCEMASAEPLSGYSIEEGAALPFWGQTQYKRSDVHTVTFINTLDNVPSNAWDVSAAKDKSVLAWMDGKDLFVGANGKIALPRSCTCLFTYFRNVTRIDFGTNIVTSNVVGMTSMFNMCEKLRDVDFSVFDTSNVTGMGYMFQGCAFTELDLSSFDTSKVERMIGMFNNCSALEKLNLSSFTSTAVERSWGMDEMFARCGNLTELICDDEAICWQFENDTGFEATAAGHNTSLPTYQMVEKIGDAAYGGSATIFGSKYMRKEIGSITFRSSLSGMPGSAWDVSEAKDGSVMAWVEPEGDLYALYIAANGNIAPNPDASCLFADFSSVKKIDFGNCFDTSEVTNMHEMFYQCYALSEVDFSSWDTSKVTSMRSMFVRCHGFEELDVSGLDTQNVTDMSYMFSNCGALKELDISSFDTSKVESMENMFAECTSLVTLNLSGLKNPVLEETSEMFRACSKLENLNLTGFGTSKVTWMANMFSGCKSLKNLDLSSLDTSSVQCMDWMFYGCDALETTDLSNLDISNVVYYQGFLSDGRLINGKPWLQFFEPDAVDYTLFIPYYHDITLTEIGETYYAYVGGGLSISDTVVTSDNPAVATVEKNGKITCVGAGTTTIRITYGNQQVTQIVHCELN